MTSSVVLRPPSGTATAAVAFDRSLSYADADLSANGSWIYVAASVPGAGSPLRVGGRLAPLFQW